MLVCALGIFFSCSEDLWNDSSGGGGESRSTNTEMTVSVAKEWYEKHYESVVTVHSSAANDVLRPMKPNWESAKENHRGRFEVVETHIKTRGSHIIIDPETNQKWEPGMKNDFVRNVARMVFLRDLKTGKTSAFVMIFVGSYEYMQTSRTMNKNTYLHREPDYDGSVLFYELNGDFINGWEYKKGKIVATISKKPEQKAVADSDSLSTRSIVQVCDTYCYTYYDEQCYEDVYSEYDEEYGTTYVVHYYCYPISYDECYQQCYYYDDGRWDDYWNTDEYPPGGYGGGGSENTGGSAPVAPKAKAIFRSSGMTEADWEKLENLLDKITDDCMGEGLYKGLSDLLKENMILFQFTSDNEAAYIPKDNTLRLNSDMDSSELFHEMLHAYQYQKEESVTSFFNAAINYEIEAHYANYLYLEGTLEYDTSNWRIGTIGGDPRILSTTNLKDILDEKGNLLDGIPIELLDTYLEFNVVPSFKQDVNYKKYTYDESRSPLSNFSNLNNITKDC